MISWMGFVWLLPLIVAVGVAAMLRGLGRPLIRSPWLGIGLAFMVVAATLAVASSFGMWSLPHGGMMFGDGRIAVTPSTVPGAVELTVIADDLFFDPATISIPVDDVVTISVENRGRIFHDFTIAEVGFRIAVDGGATAAATLPALAEGEYRFVCSVPGHAQAGMVGVLIVTAA